MVSTAIRRSGTELSHVTVRGVRREGLFEERRERIQGDVERRTFLVRRRVDKRWETGQQEEAPGRRHLTPGRGMRSRLPEPQRRAAALRPLGTPVSRLRGTKAAAVSRAGASWANVRKGVRQGIGGTVGPSWARRSRANCSHWAYRSGKADRWTAWHTSPGGMVSHPWIWISPGLLPNVATP